MSIDSAELVVERFLSSERLRIALQEAFSRREDDEGDESQRRQLIEEALGSSARVTEVCWVNEVIDMGEQSGYKLHGCTGRSWLVVELRQRVRDEP